MDNVELIMQFFKLCNLEPVEITSGVWQIEITTDMARELDGYGAKGGLFQFTFEKELAEKYGAELISPGSYRLDSFLKYIRKQATYSTACLPIHTFYEPSIRTKLLNKLAATNRNSRFYVIDYSYKYAPYFMLVVKLSYLAYEKREKIRKLIVDMVSGNIINYDIPEQLFKNGSPDTNCYKRKLSYKKAYERIQEFLTNDLAMEDPSWAKAAKEQIHQDRQRLEEYYKDSEDDIAKERRLQELMERTFPRVKILPTRAATLYIPKLEYKVMEANQTDGFSISFMINC